MSSGSSLGLLSGQGSKHVVNVVVEKMRNPRSPSPITLHEFSERDRKAYANLQILSQIEHISGTLFGDANYVRHMTLISQFARFLDEGNSLSASRRSLDELHAATFLSE